MNVASPVNADLDTFRSDVTSVATCELNNTMSSAMEPDASCTNIKSTSVSASAGTRTVTVTTTFLFGSSKIALWSTVTNCAVANASKAASANLTKKHVSAENNPKTRSHFVFEEGGEGRH
jgi:hypothetical protein